MAHDFEELSRRILGAAVDVHKALGPGLRVGQLLNFNAPTLAIKRVVF